MKGAGREVMVMKGPWKLGGKDGPGGNDGDQ